MKTRIISTTLAALLVVAGACKQENASGVPETETTGSVQAASETTTASATTTGESGGSISSMSDMDKEFVVKAGMGGLMEVQAGNLALQRATNPDVKAFAQRMVTDHSKANNELAQLATTKGLALAGELAGAPKDALDHMMTLNGVEFDKAYMTHMVDDHKKAVADFETASTSATDSDLKTWAGKTLPTLQEHAQLAVDTAKKVK